MRRQSSRVGIRDVIRAMIGWPSASGSRFRTISVSPNMPMATTTNPIPSASCGISNVNRWMPDVTSVPTRPNKSPNTTMPIACSSDPCARTTDPTSPTTMSEKYSAGPNWSASAASGGPNAAIRKGATGRGGGGSEGGDEKRGGGARKEGADRGGGGRAPRPPLRGHLVAVERGDHRGPLAGEIDEEGGRRPAVLRPVVDASEHDERR